jgi:hypothetical protein
VDAPTEPGGAGHLRGDVEVLVEVRAISLASAASARETTLWATDLAAQSMEDLRFSLGEVDDAAPLFGLSRATLYRYLVAAPASPWSMIDRHGS